MNIQMDFLVPVEEKATVQATILLQFADAV